MHSDVSCSTPLFNMLVITHSTDFITQQLSWRLKNSGEILHEEDTSKSNTASNLIKIKPKELLKWKSMVFLFKPLFKFYSVQQSTSMGQSYEPPHVHRQSCPA